MPRNTSSWRFVLARSIDMLALGELSNARSRSLNVKLNDPGSASFNIPMDDELGRFIQPYTHSIIAYRKGSTGSIPVWSGYVNTIEEDILNGKMTVNCVGWLQRFSKSFVHKDYIFQAQDDAAIIYSLVTSASNPGVADPTTLTSFEFAAGTSTATHFDGIPISWPAGSKPNTPVWVRWGGTLPNEGSGGATAYVPVTDASMGSAGRNISYTKYQTNTLQAILDLTNLENGCDIFIDSMTRVFTVYRKRMRVRDGTVSSQPAVIFGYGWGPENIQQINRTIDGSTVVNSLVVLGGSSTEPALAQDPLMNTYGLIEEIASLSDMVEFRDANATLKYYANAEVAVKRTPRQIYSFTPFNWTVGSAVPEPFVDYRLGDLVKLGVQAKPRLSAALSVRVFAMSFNIDDEGNEKIGQIQVSP